MLGNGRLEAQCFDGVKRLCHIRGKLRKKVQRLALLYFNNLYTLYYSVQFPSIKYHGKLLEIPYFKKRSLFWAMKMHNACAYPLSPVSEVLRVSKRTRVIKFPIDGTPVQLGFTPSISWYPISDGWTETN